MGQTEQRRSSLTFWISNMTLLIFLKFTDSQLCHKDPNNQLNLFLAHRAHSPRLLQSPGTLKTSDKMACPSMNNVPVSWICLTHTTWLQKVLGVLYGCLGEKVSWTFSHAWHRLLTFRTVSQIQELHRAAGIRVSGVFLFTCIFRCDNGRWYGSAAIGDINAFIFLLFGYGSDIRRGERMGQLRAIWIPILP